MRKFAKYFGGCFLLALVLYLLFCAVVYFRPQWFFPQAGNGVNQVWLIGLGADEKA